MKVLQEWEINKIGMNIIAVSGKLCSGKTTLAEGLVEATGTYTRLSLAAPLKADIARFLGTTEEVINAHKDRFRPGLQWYGTDIMRWLYGENYWVERLLEYATSTELRNIVVDDVRYPNELEALRDAAEGFMSIRLLIDTDLQMYRYEKLYGHPLSPAKMLHISETALDDYPDFDQLLNAAIQPHFLVKLARDAMERRSLVEKTAA